MNSIVRLACPAMGTMFEIMLWGGAEARLRAIAEEALTEVAAISARLSAFDPGADISRVNAAAGHGSVTVDPRTARDMRFCVALSVETGGAFDPTVGPLMRAWGHRASAPDDASRASPTVVRALCGADRVLFGADNASIELPEVGMELDAGGIGKGVALDAAAGIVRDAGVGGAFLHGGTSSSLGIGSGPDGRPWMVRVPDPWRADAVLFDLELSDLALSVSRTDGRVADPDGRAAGHVMDPRTGEPVAGRVLAAVVGSSAAWVEAWSTALLVLGVEGVGQVQAAGGGAWITQPEELARSLAGGIHRD